MSKDPFDTNCVSVVLILGASVYGVSEVILTRSFSMSLNYFLASLIFHWKKARHWQVNNS